MKKLIILRGLPGTGKSSYIAQKYYKTATPAPLAHEDDTCIVISADHFYSNLFTGEYTYVAGKIGQAHAEALTLGIQAMAFGVETIIKDDTNCSKWEYAAISAAARGFGYEIEEVDLYDGGLSDLTLAHRNTHGVPLDTIKYMRSIYER